ncbi:MAG TPA: hypothetical protein PKY96_14460 [Flavobacteriales bacterium]|nr:hypothetical protein [Flavobacteriales bacterium]
MSTPRNILLAPLVLLSGALAGQNTFNVVQHHPNTLSYNGAMSVHELADGYLVFSQGWALASPKGAIQVAKYDLGGELLWQTEHTRDRTISPGLIDPIARESAGVFVAAVDEYGSSQPINIWLYWFNAEGDTIRTRFLKSDSNATLGNHGTRQLLALADGGFLHCGWCHGAEPSNGCITRLDSAGAILWERVYPQARYIQNARELPDGGFVLGASRNTMPNNAIVIRTDALGNAQWVRYHGLHAITLGWPALAADDGSIMMPGCWKEDDDVNTYDRWSSLYQYSASGALITRKDYFYSYNAEANFVLDKQDGGYWLIGRMFLYFIDPDLVTTLWQIDENLDSLWMRRYFYFAPDDAENVISCVRATSDGGLVMCGATRQGITDPMPYLNSNWLIKLDSYGCLVPGCQNVGIEEVALGLSQYLSISPNPVAAGQPLRISFEPPAGFTPNGTLRLVVLDAQGKQMNAEQFTAHTSSFTLHTSLSVGLYYLHLTDGSRWLAGSKVVVE